MRKLIKIPAILSSFLLVLVGCSNQSEQPPIETTVEDYRILTNVGIGSSIEILTEANADGLFDEKSTVEFKITLAENYELKSVKVNSTDLSLTENNIYTFVMPSEDVTIFTTTSEVAEPPISGDTINSFEGILEIVPDLLAYDKGINKQVYTTVQRDNYSALDIYVTQEGTITQYKDLYIDEFSQYYDDDSQNKTNGIVQRGITTYMNQGVFYQITDYSGDDSSDNVQYSLYSEGQEEYVFGAGFGHYYYYNYLSFLYAATEAYSDGVLETNFNKDSFINDGILTLSVHFYSGDVESPDVEFTRNDTLTIESGVVIKAEVESFYGLAGATNFNYQTSTMVFEKGDIVNYTGERLDPSEYPLRTN